MTASTQIRVLTWMVYLKLEDHGTGLASRDSRDQGMHGHGRPFTRLC